MTGQNSLPRDVPDGLDDSHRAVMVRLLQRITAPEHTTNSTQVSPAKLFARLIEKAADANDWAAVAACSTLRSAELGASKDRKELLQAIERRLDGFECQDFTPDMAGSLAAILDAAGHRNSKAGLLLLKRLLACNREEAAAVLTDCLLKLQPTGRGFFNVTILFNERTLREQIQQAHFTRLKNLANSDSDVRALLGHQLMQTGDIAGAVTALGNVPADASWKLLAVHAEVMFWLDRIPEAKASAEAALAHAKMIPEKEQSALYATRIRCDVANGDGPGAVAWIEKLKAECPNQPGNPSTSVFAYLSAGRFEEAYDTYWSGPAIAALSGLGLPIVTRSALKQARDYKARLPGHCAIVCVMAIGDEVRFAQLLPQIAECFERVTILCDRRSRPVFARCFPRIAFHGVDLSDPAEDVPEALRTRVDRTSLDILRSADYVADLQQFAAVFRRTPADCPSIGHHLVAEPGLVQKWRAWLAESHPDRRVLGLFWRSSLIAQSAAHKKTNLKFWLGSMEASGWQIVPLQYDLTDDERNLLAASKRVLALPANFDIKNDIENALGLMKALPVVLTLPGSTQHMAGAVGATVLCPTHPFEARWRRVSGRTHEIWAPSVEIVAGELADGIEGSIRLATAMLGSDRYADA